MITMTKTKIDKDKYRRCKSKRQRQRQCNSNNLGLSEVEVGGNLRSFRQSQVLGLLEPRTTELIEPTPTKTILSETLETDQNDKIKEVPKRNGTPGLQLLDLRG